MALIAVLLLGRIILNEQETVAQPQIERKVNRLIIHSGTVLAAISSLLPEYQTQLWEVAQQYNYSYDILYDLWKCEDKSLTHDGIFGDSGLAYGAFQWHDKSWYYYNKKYDLKLNKLLFKDQVRLTILVLQEPEGWRNWTNCWLKIN